MKTCCKCKAEKPIADFHKNRTAKDGLQSACISCRRAICAEYVDKNREKVNSWARKYATKNHSKVLKSKRDWAEKNKGHIKEYGKRYIQKNLKKCNARNRLEAEVLTDNYVYRLLVPIVGLERSQIPAQMVEAKRLHLQITRKLKELKA